MDNYKATYTEMHYNTTLCAYFYVISYCNFIYICVLRNEIMMRLVGPTITTTRRWWMNQLVKVEIGTIYNFNFSLEVAR